MSRLHCISISGIRSFGIRKEDIQTIKFSTPVTIFLGQNGCGKTTIIEAIKYACTSEMPGGSKLGHGFVSDPYMHQVPEVKGQIKLSIHDVRGNKATVVRVLRCSRFKENSLKCSSIDASLSFIKQDGESQNLSGRIADINDMVINLLGVPAAILNNVIFCHQEQSLWPLDEGLTLKKKFDEIFDSVRYNNCVDSIRKHIKTKTGDLAVLKANVDGLRKFKTEVDLKKNSLEEKEVKFEKICQDITDKEATITPIDKRLNDICKLEQNMSELQSKLAIKKNEKENLTKIQNDLLKDIKKEYPGTDEELNVEIATFNNKEANRKIEINNLQKKLQTFEKSESQLTKIIQKKNNILVETNKDIETLNNKKNERNNVIIVLSGELNCPVQIETDEDAVKCTVDLKSYIDELESNIEKQVKINKNNRDKLQSTVDDATKTFNEAQQEEKFIKNEINTLQNETRDIRLKLKDLSVSDDTLKNYEKQINLIDKDLKILGSTFNEKVLKDTIDSDKRKIRELSDELDCLERELRNWQKNSVLDKEIENLQSSILQKQNDIDKIKYEHESNFKELFGTIPEENVRDSVESKLRQNNNNISELNMKINQIQKKLTTVEMELKHTKVELKDSETELRKNKFNIDELCNPLSYHEKSNVLETRIAKLQKEKGQFSSAKVMYETIIENLNKDKNCPICSTNFSNKENAIKEIVATLQKKIQDIPKKLSITEIKLEKDKDLYKRLTQLEPANRRIDELNERIPIVQQKFENMTKEVEETTARLQSLKSDLTKHMKIGDICGKVLSRAAIIDQNRKEINDSNEQMEVLEMQLIKVDTNRSKLQTESEIDNKKIDLAKLRQNCDDNQNKLNLNSKQYQDLREKRNMYVQKQFDLQKKVQGKPQMLDRIIEIEKKEENLKEKLLEIATRIVDSKNHVIEAKSHLDTVTNEDDILLKTKQKEYHSCNGMFSDVKKMQLVIEKLLENDPINKLQSLADELATLKTKLQEITDSKETLANQINDLNIQQANQEHSFRLLKDNLALRDKRKMERLMEDEIQELVKEIGNHNYRSVLQEKNKLQTERLKTNTDLQRSIGSKSQLANEISDLKKELLRPCYKNAYVSYKDKFIDHKVVEEAIKNMKLYVTTLETAVCEFHKSRMKDINRSIRQLWRHIYRGNDIDFIEIVTEIDHSTSKRIYKYKVMQFKNGIKMEMRGRCSAGQKVLACLIIRMALAETFSIHCGILALDEPTTNLDRENIDSLCDSLINIINSRAAQKNFQLLIITHDEEFIYKLRNVQQLKDYYKVMRDVNGNTLIKRETL